MQPGETDSLLRVGGPGGTAAPHHSEQHEIVDVDAVRWRRGGGAFHGQHPPAVDDADAAHADGRGCASATRYGAASCSTGTSNRQSHQSTRTYYVTSEQKTMLDDDCSDNERGSKSESERRLMSAEADEDESEGDDACGQYGSSSQEFAINLEDVSSRLLIPAETLTEQLLVHTTLGAPCSPSNSKATDSGTATPTSSGRSPALRRQSTLRIDAPEGLVLEDAVVTKREALAGGVLVRTTSTLSRGGAALDTVSDGGGAKKRQQKRVHFPDNVVKSVCIVPVVDGGHELHVEYRRPPYAFVFFFLSNIGFVAAWSEIMRASWPATSPGESLAASVSVVTFLSLCFSGGFLLLFIGLTWRLTEYERIVIRQRWFLVRLAKLVACGTAAQTLLMLSCMSHVTCVNSISFTTMPLIALYCYERSRHHSFVSGTDSFGTVACAIGLIVLCVGEERADRGSRGARLLAIVASVVGGVLMAPYLSLLRIASKDTSNAALITLSVLCAAFAAAAATAASGGFSASVALGHGDTVDYGISALGRKETLRVMLSGAFLFTFWFLHHKASLYFDRLTIVGGYSLCAPLVLVAFHIQGLPTMEHLLEVIGGILVTAGCLAVGFSGWLYRKNVAIPIYN